MRHVCWLTYFIYAFYINVCECRVYCQDRNALPWTPSGYSCPVTCKTIDDAVHKLTIKNYHKIIRQKIDNKLRQEILNDKTIIGVRELNAIFLRLIRRNYVSLFKNENDTEIIIKDHNDNNDIDAMITNRNNQIENDDKDRNRNENIVTNLIEDTDAIDDNKDIENDVNTNSIQNNLNDNLKNNYDDQETTLKKDIVKIERNNNINDKYGCWSFEKFDTKLLLIKLTRNTCTRKSNFDGRLLEIMTNILNQYINSPFKFTKEITEVLLENLFGKNTDLRNNIFDVNNLLKYLKKAINLHRTHEKQPKIYLGPRHCLLIKIPGCFCKSGYVENDGQCVAPYECIHTKEEEKYLARIVVQ